MECLSPFKNMNRLPLCFHTFQSVPDFCSSTAPPPSRTHWHKPCSASSAAARAEPSTATCTRQHLLSPSLLNKNQGPASRVAHNGSSFHQGFLHVFARRRDSRCRPMLSRSPCTRAGPVPPPPTIIQPIINRIRASAFHALHPVSPPPAAPPAATPLTQCPAATPLAAQSASPACSHPTNDSRSATVTASEMPRIITRSHTRLQESLYDPVYLTRLQVHALRFLQVPRRLGRLGLQHAVRAVRQAGVGRS